MIPEKTKGQVAVIGSGPAGLTIAGDLARKGFNVEIFEMEREAGGVLLYGIPEYRLPKEVVRHEIAKISALGVKFHLGVTIGEDMTIDDLFAKGFDAIFIGTGAGLPKKRIISWSRPAALSKSATNLSSLPMFMCLPDFARAQLPSHCRSCAQTRPQTAGRLLRLRIISMALPKFPFAS